MYLFDSFILYFKRSTRTKQLEDISKVSPTDFSLTTYTVFREPFVAFFSGGYSGLWGIFEPSWM